MANDDTTRHDREKLRSKITRRDVLKASGAATGAAMLGVGSAQARGHDGEEVDIDSIDIEETDVTVTEGSYIGVTPSPDGESLVMSLHGVLFSLPRNGGDAKPLTDEELEPARPDYSPDGERVALQAYVDGTWDVWTMTPDGSDLRQLTTGLYDDREPKWSPDGSQIVFSSDRRETYDIWTVDVDTGELEQWTDTDGENFEPAWSPDGAEIAYVSNPAEGDGGDTDTPVGRIESIDQDGDTRTLITAEEGDTLHSPSWSPNGDDIAYIRESENPDSVSDTDLMVSEEQVTAGETVFGFSPDWLSPNELLYSADGTIRVLELGSDEASEVPFSATFHFPEINYDQKSYFNGNDDTREVKGVVSPTLSPDGEHVAFVALNDLWVMRIGDSPERITDDLFSQIDPAWSPDGRYLAYSSDKAGIQDVYVHDMQTGTDQQVTAIEDSAVVSAAWSPDGSQIAVQNENRATLTVEVDISEEGEVDAGEVREVVEPLFLPGQPTWSADGTTIALAALNQYSNRFRAGTSQILTVDTETGEKNYYSPGDSRHTSISTRDMDGPVWSPDGRWMAFVVESTLRVMPVTDDGEPDGPAKQITEEATDAPTWSGDSEWLLYLHNGQLKKVKRDGSVTKDVPLPLTYQHDEPTDHKVIYAGRIWDGTSQDIHEDVIIEIANNRIQSVTPDSEPPEGDYVDASNLTVIPGLWDSHVHDTYSQRFFGVRQGRINLAYGVTSTVSVGDRAYRSIEEREAVETGSRLGPRFFAMGEPIDGSRIYYSFIGRPTTSIKQVPLEMSRAIELDYDMGKTYVRLNAKRMQLVTDINHSVVGVPTKSHYLTPGGLVGQNGTTHMTSDRKSTVAPQIYEDIVNLYVQTERSATTTFFTTKFYLADEIRDDPRIQLFPPVEPREGLSEYIRDYIARESLLNAVEGNTEYPSDPDRNTALGIEATTFKRIFDRGGVVLTGTDMPLDFVGLAVHGNLRPLVAYGLSPYEALLTATRYPAERMGVEDDLGTLESGKLADMAFIDGNPIENIRDAIQVEMTMKNGELYTIDELVEPFEETKNDDEIDADGDGAIDEDNDRNDD